MSDFCSDTVLCTMHLHINFYPRVFNLLLLLVWYLRTLSFRYCLTEAYHAPDYIQFPVFPADGGISRHNPLYRFSTSSCKPAFRRAGDPSGWS
ncbi:hypothetical protein ECED1_3559 [Escherichia coli ED1a]|uniref:Uncharacterized protein n=1 Tax=Escherichia coli O81 (strain ED1a) TaxID=585397 RepID=B7N043_ECO81|nr:hypothetical protein ECED1_3559 [Escherichia coli ED1a]